MFAHGQSSASFPSLLTSLRTNLGLLLLTICFKHFVFASFFPSSADIFYIMLHTWNTTGEIKFLVTVKAPQFNDLPN